MFEEPLQFYLNKDKILTSSSRQESASKKIASKIVTSFNDNVTIRNIAPRTLSYSPTKNPPKDAVIIGALKGMELSDHLVESDAEQFGCDVEMDDLLEEDLMEMERAGSSKVPQEERIERHGRHGSAKKATSRKLSSKKNAPLGIQNKKKLHFFVGDHLRLGPLLRLYHPMGKARG